MTEGLQRTGDKTDDPLQRTSKGETLDRWENPLREQDGIYSPDHDSYIHLTSGTYDGDLPLSSRLSL